MKKILYLLLLSTLLISCSSDDDGNEEKKEPTQDYTSFVITIDASPNFPNCVAAYKKDGIFYKISNLGDLTRGKYSPEVRVNDNTITEVYIFTDYMSPRRFDEIYSLKKNKKNNIIVGNGTKGIEVTDKKDPTQYPQ